MGEPASISVNAERTATTVAFRDRFTAEKLFYGSRDISGVGKVEMAWVSNAAPAAGPATPVTPASAMLPTGGDGDGDVAMGNADVTGVNGAKGEGGRPQEAKEVEYDVADDDDGWVA